MSRARRLVWGLVERRTLEVRRARRVGHGLEDHFSGSAGSWWSRKHPRPAWRPRRRCASCGRAIQRAAAQRHLIQSEGGGTPHWLSVSGGAGANRLATSQPMRRGDLAAARCNSGAAPLPNAAATPRTTTGVPHTPCNTTLAVRPPPANAAGAMPAPRSCATPEHTHTHTHTHTHATRAHARLHTARPAIRRRGPAGRTSWRHRRHS